MKVCIYFGHPSKWKLFEVKNFCYIYYFNGICFLLPQFPALHTQKQTLDRM